jgi:hypothetical protein
MKRRTPSVWPIVAMALLVSACGPSAPPVPGASDVHAQLQAEMEKGSMDFGSVTIVRLLRDGKRLEVASVAPTFVAQAAIGTVQAKTIFRVNDKGDALTLFTRDLPNGRSFKSELTFAQLESGKQFTFPVVQADGQVREEKFSVERIIRANQGIPNP